MLFPERNEWPLKPLTRRWHRWRTPCADAAPRPV